MLHVHFILFIFYKFLYVLLLTSWIGSYTVGLYRESRAVKLSWCKDWKYVNKTYTWELDNVQWELSIRTVLRHEEVLYIIKWPIRPKTPREDKNQWDLK